MRKSKKIRVILTTAAALIASAGAVLFVKRKAIKRHFGIYSIAAALTLCGVLMFGATTAYATELEPEPGEVTTDTETETETETDIDPDEDGIIEVITGEEVEIDMGDFINPDREPNQITPPGNLTLVDDFDGARTLDKQFITVTTKNGNYFYIIIDREGNNENVYFLNLVDEFDLLQILQGEDAATPPLPPGAVVVTPEEPQEQEAEPIPTPQQSRNNNNNGLLIGILVIVAVGGGAFYYFKVMKPKQSGTKQTVKSELDEFDFDPDDDDFFTDSEDEPDGAEYDGYGDSDTESDDDIPGFTALEPPTPDSPLYDYGDHFTFESSEYSAETPESEDKE